MIAKAKVLTSEAEKEEGGFGQLECRAHFLSGGGGWELGPPFPWPVSGPTLVIHPRQWGFPPGRLHSFSIRSLMAHPVQHTLALPEPLLNCLGSLQTLDCWLQVGREHRIDLLWEGAQPSPTPRVTTGTKEEDIPRTGGRDSGC